MALTNQQFSDQFTTMVGQLIAGSITSTLFDSEYKTLLDEWGGPGTITIQGLSESVDSLVTNWTTRETQFRAWVGGTPTGGYTDSTGATLGGGFYPMTNGLGVTYYVPCPAYVTSVTQKGDPAHEDLNFWAAGTLGASEVLGEWNPPYAATFVQAYCRARCRVLPTGATVVLTLNKVASGGTVTAFGTVTFTPGSNVGTVSLTLTTLSATDTLQLVAPAAMDATLADVSVTLAGS